jgi:hypothetical protein
MVDILKPVSIIMDDGQSFTGLLSLTQDENAVLIGEGAPGIAPNYEGQGYLARATKQFYTANNLGQWVPLSVSTSNAGNLGLLQDVTVTSLANGQTLTYNTVTGKWINTTIPIPTLATLTDVGLTALSNGQVLSYSSITGTWINSSAGGGGGATTLANLTDVDINSLQSSDALFYNALSGKWVNGAIPTPTLYGCSDVFISLVNTGQVLTFDFSSGGWINSNLILDGLLDVVLTAPSNGQVLTYNIASSSWINSTPAGGGGATTLDELTDVSAASPSNSDILFYAGTEWVNTPLELDRLLDVWMDNPVQNEVLYYNGSIWKDELLTLDLLHDVVIDGSVNTPEVNQVLKLGSNNKWTNKQERYVNLLSTKYNTPITLAQATYDSTPIEVNINFQADTGRARVTVSGSVGRETAGYVYLTLYSNNDAAYLHSTNTGLCVIYVPSNLTLVPFSFQYVYQGYDDLLVLHMHSGDALENAHIGRAGINASITVPTFISTDVYSL